MKPGRNDPCPCGSGKKYKKCCYLKEQIITAVTNTESQNEPDDEDYPDDDDYQDESEEFYSLINNIRNYLLEGKQHIREYIKIRKMHSEIISAMGQYYFDDKFQLQVNKEIIPDTGHKNSPISLDSNFDLETREGIQGFYDSIVYKSARNINCITEDFIKNHRYRKPEKIELLQSMLQSKLGLFEITGTDMNEGYAYIKNVFTGDEYTLIDIGLSGDQNFGDFYIYTRIISYHGINFGTGLNLIFEKKDNFIKNHILSHKKDFSEEREYLRFVELYNRFSEYPGKVPVFNNTF